MMMSSGAWLEIARYADFHDLPRLVLVADRASGFWILDSEYDDEQDEYSSSYKVYFAGPEPEQAQAAFEQHENGVVGVPVGTLPIARFEFDLTRRRELILKNAG